MPDPLTPATLSTLQPPAPTLESTKSKARLKVQEWREDVRGDSGELPAAIGYSCAVFETGLEGLAGEESVSNFANLVTTSLSSPENFSLDLVRIPTTLDDSPSGSAGSWELLTPSIIAAAQSPTAHLTSRDFLSFSNSIDFLSLSRTGSNPPSASLQTTSVIVAPSVPRTIRRSPLRPPRETSTGSSRNSIFRPPSFLLRLTPARSRSKSTSLSLAEIQSMPSKAASILGVDSSQDYVQRGATSRLRQNDDEDDDDDEEERNSAHATTTSVTTGRSFCFSRRSHQHQDSGSTIPPSLGKGRKMSITAEGSGGGSVGRRSLSDLLTGKRKSTISLVPTSPAPLDTPPVSPLSKAKPKPRLAKLFFSRTSRTTISPSSPPPSPLSSRSTTSQHRLSNPPPPSPTSSLASSSWRAPDSWLITPDDVEILKCGRARAGSSVREGRRGSVGGSWKGLEREETEECEEERLVGTRS